MNQDDNHIQEELQELVGELNTISDDLSRYFQYRDNRRGLLQNILSVSHLN